MKNKSAFTLVEILVVVLIIGILTAVAIPMYQSAVDKTHWSTLLPTARALKNAEEAYLMATNAYTDNADALDVAATEGDASYNLQMPDAAARYVIRASTTKLPNVRLAQYLEDNASYADLLFCEAATDDERANKLCEKTLNGQKVYTTADSYRAYLIDSPCRKGTNYLESDKCGFENTKGQTLNKGEVCIGTSGELCKNSVIEDGGECLANAGTYTCGWSSIKAGGKCISSVGWGCVSATINEGGMCIDSVGHGCRYANAKGGVIVCNGSSGNCGEGSTVTNGGACVNNSSNSHCYGVKFQNGSICYANKGVCNKATYDDTSCCCGSKCGDGPSCASRGKTCDPYYMDPNNFK